MDNHVATPTITSAQRILFHLERDEDETGVSGIGRVAEGIIFSNGKVVLSWLTEATSLAVYENMNHLETIHGHGGKTRVVIDYMERRERKAETLSEHVEEDNSRVAVPQQHE